MRKPPPGPVADAPQGQQQPGFGAPRAPQSPPAGFGAPQGPPQQPPSAPGGFGAPTGRPYGHPQSPGAPPAQPGYGFPAGPPQPNNQPGAQPQQPNQPGAHPPMGQQPPQGYAYPQSPPQPPQGYAYPPMQQPPPGYGYPAGQQQPPPPGYGYPGAQQPSYGGYQPPPPTAQVDAGGGGKKPSPVVLIVTAAVVVVALIVGAGVLYATSSDKDDDRSSSAGADADGKGGGDAENGSGGTEKFPSDPASRLSLQVPNPEIAEDDVISAKGSWLAGSVYAKSNVNAVKGYDVSTGKELWNLPLAGQSCAGSRTVGAGGLAAVVYQEAKATKENKYPQCNQISVFDMKTGVKKWTRSVELSGSKASFEEVSISGSTVVVGSGNDGGAGFTLAGGKPIWEPKVSDTCEDIGYAGGPRLVAVHQCGGYEDPKLQVQLLDPATGKAKWTYNVPAGIEDVSILSTKPVVFGAETGDDSVTGVTDAFVLTEKGALATKITLPDGKYAHRCEVNMVDACHDMAVGNNRLYVPTAERRGSGTGVSMTNEIVSFDLTTGKSTGERADAGDDYTLQPLRMDGDRILAYKAAPYDHGGQVVSIDPKTMKQRILLKNPSTESVRDAESSFVSDRAEMLYENGALFIADDLLSKPSSGSQHYVALGFTRE
ncbi:PQQ-binding-like beta-propeller repeat protein [Streptomyces tsukubensis]|uniref:Pyrrolo-quinoline quinone repeat domain-containing protein n=1 Tax=Streptomyces tsukubensis TaxID=83656 RepID=A0A1V4A4V8_9ACTN|nr:hypothetical protein B1H18_21755 [Streptomyces tsukubensis]QFR97746.1 PQQ-binding-like beta-propeller repeat protein [Streptomyces tsukubensis]